MAILDNLPNWARLTFAALLMIAVGMTTIWLMVVTQSSRESTDDPARNTTFQETAFPLNIVSEIIATNTQLPTKLPASSSPTPPNTLAPTIPTITLTPSVSPTNTQIPLPSLTATQVATLTPVGNTSPSTDVSSDNDADIQLATVDDAASDGTVLDGSLCNIPGGWVAHTVQAGDTLFAFQLGTGSEVTVDDILQGNCLSSRLIFEGQTLWLPAGAADNAPSSYTAPTAFPTNDAAPPGGLSRSPQCPCEIIIQSGWRLEQIAELIDSLPVGFSGREFLLITGRGTSLANQRFMEGAPSGTSLEGFMFPDAYTVTNSMDARAFVLMALERFGMMTSDQLWADAAAGGLSPYEAVTLASIITRESGSAEQQALISSVFHNRLDTGRGLGATVTTQYALGHSGDWWPNAAGQVSTFDSPYNTNIYRGLPPSPIASPSLQALRAAIYPADTNFLYFTANCRGSGNAYAETYEQHLANVNCD